MIVPSHHEIIFLELVSKVLHISNPHFDQFDVFSIFLLGSGWSIQNHFLSGRHWNDGMLKIDGVTISKLWNSPGWWTMIIQHLKWIKYDKMNYISQLIMVNMVNSMMFDTESSYNHHLQRFPTAPGEEIPCDAPAELCEAGNSWPIWRVQRRENWKRRENMGELGRTPNMGHGICW